MLQASSCRDREEHARRARRVRARASPRRDQRSRRHRGVGALDVRGALHVAPGGGGALLVVARLQHPPGLDAAAASASTTCSQSVHLTDLLLQESEVRERVGLSEPAVIGGRLALPVLQR